MSQALHTRHCKGSSTRHPPHSEFGLPRSHTYAAITCSGIHTGRSRKATQAMPHSKNKTEKCQASGSQTSEDTTNVATYNKHQITVNNGQSNVNQWISLSMNQLIVTIHCSIERIVRCFSFSVKDRSLHLVFIVFWTFTESNNSVNIYLFHSHLGSKW